MKYFQRLGHIALILMLIFLALIPAASAQGELGIIESVPFDLTIEITGEVQFVEGEITIGGVVIAPAGAFIPALLTEGQIVTVIGILLDDDTLRAIELITDPDLIGDDEESIDEELVDEEPVDEEPVDEEPVDEEPVDEEPARACVPNTHPVANQLAREFDVDVSVIIDLHCQGYGFGNIARAYLISAQTEDDPEALLSDAQFSGWGTIIRESGLHPSDLAPGRAIGGRSRNSNDGGDTGGDETTTMQTGGNQGNNPGVGRGQGNNPGQGRGQGNNPGGGNGRGSDNNPGQGRGNSGQGGGGGGQGRGGR